MVCVALCLSDPTTEATHTVRQMWYWKQFCSTNNNFFFFFFNLSNDLKKGLRKMLSLCFYFSLYLNKSLKKGIKFSVKICPTKPQDAFSYNSLTSLDCDFFGNCFQHFVLLCHLWFGGNPKCFLQYDGQVNTIPSLL